MIANRGAVAAALEQWNERRRRIFYPKTDFDFDLESLRRRKHLCAEIDPGKVARLLDEEVTSLEPIAGGTFHALFRFVTPTRRCILKLSTEEPAFGFAVESWAMQRLRETRLPSLSIPAF